jgi:hypothetical protein
MFVLTVLAGLGVCGLAAAVMVPTMLGSVGAWPVLAVGFVVLLGAVGGLWRLYSRRDRSLW